MIRPHLVLTNYRIDGVLHTLGRIVISSQQPLDHFPHTRPGGFLPLPVNGAFFPKHLCQLPCHSHQLVVFVKIPNSLRLGQRVIESHLLRGQPQPLPTALLSNRLMMPSL